MLHELTRAVRMEGADDDDSRLDVVRDALRDWRPFYRFASRHLTAPDDSGDRSEDLLAALYRSIEWDKVHRVRYRLWRAYIAATRPSDAFGNATAGLRAFVQRGRRGYADVDVWNMSCWLGTTVPAMLEQLRRRAHAWPGEPLSFEEWAGDGGVLDEIAAGFRAATSISDGVYLFSPGPSYEELSATFERGMDLFRFFFVYLGD